MAVILVDILGLEKIASSFGLTVLFQGAAIVAGPPIAGIARLVLVLYDPPYVPFVPSPVPMLTTLFAGAIRDGTGSYVYSFLWGGSIMVFGAILILSRKAWLALQEHWSREKLRRVWQKRRKDSTRPLKDAR